VGLVRALLRVYSLLFLAGLSLALLAISTLALLSGSHSLNLAMLPWSGRELTYWLLFSGLFSLAAVVLALIRKARMIFFLWSVAVAAMLIRGFFFSSYYFGDAGAFSRAAYLTFAALLAVVGAWFQLTAKSDKRKFRNHR